MGQYDSMSWQIFIYGLKLILGLHLSLLPSPHPTLPLLQLQVSTSSMECKTDLTSGFGPHYANIETSEQKNTSRGERDDKFHYIYLLSLIIEQSQH